MKETTDQEPGWNVARRRYWGEVATAQALAFFFGTETFCRHTDDSMRGE